MADEVLSQSEIDKLLSALSDGTVSAEEVKADEEQKKVKTYDFKRPDKFSKDQIRTLFRADIFLGHRRYEFLAVYEDGRLRHGTVEAQLITVILPSCEL